MLVGSLSLEALGCSLEPPNADRYRPCKTRKVKCDETRPTCSNCQRQGEACDYSIRLNWDGRGKKKTEGNSGVGLVDFSAGVISVRPASIPKSGNSTSSKTPSRTEFRVQRGYWNDPQPVKADATQRSDIGTVNRDSPPSPQKAIDEMKGRESDSSMIDPALVCSTNPPKFSEGFFVGGRPEKYTQSYERYRSLTPSTPISVHQPAISRIRQARVLNESSSSPTDSGVRSPDASTFSNPTASVSSVRSPNSTPPFVDTGKDHGHVAPPDTSSSSDRPPKRIRHHVNQEVNSPTSDAMMPPPHVGFCPSFNVDPQVSSVIMALPSPISTPSTPTSMYSDDAHKVYTSRLLPHSSLDSPASRRLSVSSLLCGPVSMAIPTDRSINMSSDLQDWSLQSHDVYQDTTHYGIDRGFKDLDIGKNDDMNAISGLSPVAMRYHLDYILDKDGEISPLEFGFGMEVTSTALEGAAYYDKPVPIYIPRILEPLPSKLLENPMNLLVSAHQARMLKTSADMVYSIS